MLDVDVHRDQGDDEDGAGGQVDRDDVVGELPLEGHHEDSGPLLVGGGGDLGDGELGQVRHAAVDQGQGLQLYPLAGRELGQGVRS